MIRYTTFHRNDKKKALYQYQQWFNHFQITLFYFYNKLFELLMQLLFGNLRIAVKSKFSVH